MKTAFALGPFERCPSLLALALVSLALVAVGTAVAEEAAPEFGGQCVMSLAEGRRIDTDCGVSWNDGHGRRYCFGSETSRTSFLTDPQGHLRRACDFGAAGDTSVTVKGMEHYRGEDVRAFVEAEIRKNAARSGGSYRFHDGVTNRDLDLVFEKIDFVRTLHGHGFFPEAVFHTQDDENKKYLIDFWVKPDTEGLRLLDVRIYKGPVREGAAWVLKPRSPRPWWWIPASEHPGETEEKRAWEVMSAVEEHIVKQRAAGNGTYRLKDDQTGEDLALDFIGTHLPVRRLSDDGRYFACTDFRRPGKPDEVYDIDFWLDERDGRISVGRVRVHKVPVNEDGIWTQVPRYDFDDLKFDIVP